MDPSKPDKITSLEFADNTPTTHTDVEDMLLFSAEPTAVEVTYGGLRFDDSVAALYPGSIVTKPVPVMVEGTYKVYNRNTNKYEEIVITAQDIQEYHQNTPRDVAMNYQHKRGEPVGWLRLRDTAVCKPIKTKQGEKLALFASMELFDDAAKKVQRGVFRDCSIELRPHTKEIIGNALTDFPIMRDTQFYSDDIPVLDMEFPVAPVVEAVTEPVTEPTPQEAPTQTPDKENVQMDPKEVLEQALAQYGLKPTDLQYLPTLIKSTEEEKAKAALTNAKTTVQQFSADEAGNSYLTGEALEAAAKLLVFSQEHAETEIHFGEGDETTTVNPAALLEKVLKSVKAIQVFGETPGVSAENINPELPVNTDPQQDVDPDRVSSIKARIKSNLKNSAA